MINLVRLASEGLEQEQVCDISCFRNAVVQAFCLMLIYEA
jgi:hypothetical protein